MIYATFLDDLSVFMDDLRRDMWPLVFLALIFICLAAMTLMNMLVGVLCEVVSAVAETEKQQIITQKVSEEMFEIACKLDTILDLRQSNLCKVKDVLNIWKQVKLTTNFNLDKL